MRARRRAGHTSQAGTRSWWVAYDIAMRRTMLGALLLPAAALAAQTVEGHIVNAANGSDVAGATVILGQVGGHREQPYRATTDSQGRFRIDDVEAGTYTLFYR